MSTIGNLISPVLTAESGLSKLNSLLNSQPSYFSQLHIAYFNNTPFFTTSASTEVGRRNAEHIYPFRDTPWVEDIGRKARRYHIVGFLVGDDVIAQRDSMQRDLERPGPGILNHPTYGRLTVSALDQCTFEEDMTHGRVIKMNLVFEESGEQIYPTIQTSSSSVTVSATKTSQSALSSFISKVKSAVAATESFVNTSINTGLSWIKEVQGYVTDATSLYNMGSSIVGGFGRFFGGASGASSGSINGLYVTPSQVLSSISSLVLASAAAREALSVSISQAIVGLNSGDPATMGSAIQSLASSLAQYITSPSDGVRIFSTLNNFSPTNNLPSSAIGADQLEIQNSINDICRLSAAIALAQFSSTYQPSSQQDAENVRNQVCDILDAEILIAGDEGQDDLFYSLTDLRNSVAQDLTTRGAALPPLQTFTTNIPMPALVLAYQYYQDITRTDQLVASANPIHPAFMPISFQALSS